MMAPWRVIVVKDAQLFTSQQVKILISYCEKPSSSTCLILLGGSLGPWRGHLNVLEKNGKAIAFSHPKGSALTRHMARIARQLGKEIAPEAADLMREMVGNHLAEVYQELSKLACYVGDRREIQVEDVETVISPIRSHSIFDLTRAIGMKKCPDALGILHYMLEGGEPPLRILTMIVRQFRLLWVAKEMRSLGVRDRDIGKALSIPDFVLQGFLTQMGNFTAKELEEGYGHLFQADLVLKSRSTPRGIVLEKLIISLCH
jgi:DNA polymerase-3 subunit delta